MSKTPKRTKDAEPILFANIHIGKLNEIERLVVFKDDDPLQVV
jgi:hypothetical protein